MSIENGVPERDPNLETIARMAGTYLLELAGEDLSRLPDQLMQRVQDCRDPAILAGLLLTAATIADVVRSDPNRQNTATPDPYMPTRPAQKFITSTFSRRTETPYGYRQRDVEVLLDLLIQDYRSTGIQQGNGLGSSRGGYEAVKEVMTLSIKGLGNQEIAGSLGKSQAGVDQAKRRFRTYVSSLAPSKLSGLWANAIKQVDEELFGLTSQVETGVVPETKTTEATEKSTVTDDSSEVLPEQITEEVDAATVNDDVPAVGLSEKQSVQNKQTAKPEASAEPSKAEMIHELALKISRKLYSDPHQARILAEHLAGQRDDGARYRGFSGALLSAIAKQKALDVERARNGGTPIILDPEITRLLERVLGKTPGRTEIKPIPLSRVLAGIEMTMDDLQTVIYKALLQFDI